MPRSLSTAVRPTAIAALLLFVAATSTLAQTQPAAAPQPDLVAVYRQYVDAINRGDAAGAAAFFTDDGAFLPPGCPAGTGCVGRTAIQSRIQGIVDSSRRFTIVGAQVSAFGPTMTAREEHRAPVVTAAGVERYIFKGTLTFQGDKIARLVYEFDLSDPQTAAFVAFLQRQAQPSPTPAAPAAPRPARTGFGGLLDGSEDAPVIPAAAGLALLIGAGAALFALRRVRASLTRFF